MKNRTSYYKEIWVKTETGDRLETIKVTRKAHNRKKFYARRTTANFGPLIALFISVALCGYATLWDTNIEHFAQAQEIVIDAPITPEMVKGEEAKITAAGQATTSTPLAKPSSEIERVESLIREIWGEDAEIGLALAKCESSLIQTAANSKSTARGVFQFLEATWKYERKLMGRSQDLNLRFDAYENILTGYSHYKRNGLHQPWAESMSCVESKLSK